MKKTARLNSSLLARKGFASPAAAVPMFGKANHYGHMHHHHIRDVVYDHVDPYEANGDEAIGQIDLDPPQVDESADIAAPATDEKEETPRGLIQRVQKSLRSFNQPGDEKMPESPADQTNGVTGGTEALASGTSKSGTTKSGTSKRQSKMQIEGCCKGNPSSKRVAMTLRLDPTRHLRLRVLSAHVNRSSQEILTEALDSFLDRFADMPEMQQCDCLRGEIEKKRDKYFRLLQSKSGRQAV